MLRGTPFHARTSRLCQGWNWRRWSGYVVAGSYELTHEREYHAIRSAAALIDVSPLYKYRIRGPDAPSLLDRVLTRDAGGAAVDRVLYTPWCDDRGKVRDDGTLARLGEEDYRLTAAEPNLRWLERNAVGLDVRVEDESDRLAALAVQGPTSRDVLRRSCDTDLDSLAFFRHTRGTIDGIEASITRTGYTGDLGYELWVKPESAEAVWDRLIAEGTPYGLTPAGILALDVARIEAGLLLIDVDYVPAHRAFIELRKSSPYELGLGWTVKLEKPFFVGRDALRVEREREPEWQFRGLAVDWDSLEAIYREFDLPPQLPTTAWRTSVPVYGAGDQVGYATSGCWSPTLKRYVALAHLRAPHATPGTEVEIEVTVEHRRRRALAYVRELPFFDPERKRA